MVLLLHDVRFSTAVPLPVALSLHCRSTVVLVSLLTNPRYTSQAVFIGTGPVCSGLVLIFGKALGSAVATKNHDKNLRNTVFLLHFTRTRQELTTATTVEGAEVILGRNTVRSYD